MVHGRAIAVASVGLWCACSSEPLHADANEVAHACEGKCDGAGPSAPDAEAFRICESEAAPAGKAQSAWRHASSTIVALGAAWHSAEDVMATTDATVHLRGKFAYGSIGKDLEDELVEVWIDACDGLRRLGSGLTNGDGRVTLKLSPADLPDVGRYRVHMRVAGDGSRTSATLWVVPPESRIAVFDIDGTLTASDWELVEDIVDDVFEPILYGDAPKARSGAAEATWARHDQGYLVVYLTGRPYWLTQRSRDWLRTRGMAPGVLHTTQRSADVMPTESGVGAYKADYLAGLQLAGLHIDVAYGNATTDVFAYEEAGIPKDATFVLGRHGGEAGTIDLGDDYEHHLATVELDPIDQPF